MPASTRACMERIWLTGRRTVTRSVGCLADLGAISDLWGFGLRCRTPGTNKRLHADPCGSVCCHLSDTPIPPCLFNRLGNKRGRQGRPSWSLPVECAAGPSFHVEVPQEVRGFHVKRRSDDAKSPQEGPRRE